MAITDIPKYWQNKVLQEGGVQQSQCGIGEAQFMT